MIIYGPLCYGIPEGDECMTWISHWKLGSQEEGPGDEIEISVLTFRDIDTTTFELKEIGVNLEYEEQEVAGVPSAEGQKIRQNSDATSQYVIPVDEQPWAYLGTTQLYIFSCVD